MMKKSKEKGISFLSLNILIVLSESGKRINVKMKFLYETILSPILMETDVIKIKILNHIKNIDVLNYVIFLKKSMLKQVLYIYIYINNESFV